MKIREMIEHLQSIEKDGYDDAHFHKDIVPDFKCPNCGKKAPPEYRPLTTKYPDGQVV